MRLTHVADDGTDTVTTTYIGSLYERIDDGVGADEHRMYVRAGGGRL
jgi:hypothetical protein